MNKTECRLCGSEVHDRDKNSSLCVNCMIDEKAIYFARNWYRHPLFESVGTYEGIRLGEPSEYDLFPEFIKILKELMSE